MSLPVHPPAAPAEDAVLVRVAVRGRRWARQLPVAPAGTLLTVSLGAARLMPATEDAARRRGYRIVGVADDGRPSAGSVDVLVPAEVRQAHPSWWQELGTIAERIFDLRLGPVQYVLASQLALHARALPG